VGSFVLAIAFSVLAAAGVRWASIRARGVAGV
jgi:hypothetical protein